MTIFISSCSSHNSDSVVNEKAGKHTQCYAYVAINDKEDILNYLSLIDNLTINSYKAYIAKDLKSALVLSSEVCDHDNGNIYLTQDAINEIILNDEIMWKNGFRNLTDIDFTSDKVVSSDELCAVRTELYQGTPELNQGVAQYLRDKIGIPVLANLFNGTYHYFFLYIPCTGDNKLVLNFIEPGIKEFQEE